jgi:hypothetical protein
VHRRWGSASCVSPRDAPLESASTHRSRGEGAVEGAGLLTRRNVSPRSSPASIDSMRDALRDCAPPGPRPPREDRLRDFRRRRALRTLEPRAAGADSLRGIAPEGETRAGRAFTIAPISECPRHP